MDAKSLATTGVLELTGGKDTKAAAERYYSKAFIQHSPIFPGGWDGLIASIDHAKEAGATYTILRAIGEGDMAVIHSRVTGLAATPWIMFNVYRIEDGKIAEHWEGICDEEEIPSGRTMIDGPTEPEDLDKTQENKDVVRRMIEQVYMDVDLDSMAEFYDGDSLVQHSHLAPDGVAPLRQAYAEAGGKVSKLHYVVGEGSFVYAMSEGVAGGLHLAVHDLFRVANGKIAEHWDVMIPIPEQPPHNNGLF